MIGWSRTHYCCMCSARPIHRVRKKEPGAVWIYFCNEHFHETYDELMKGKK